MKRFTFLLSSAFLANPVVSEKIDHLFHLRSEHSRLLESRDFKQMTAVEEAFHDCLHDFRPLFTLDETLKKGPSTAKRLHHALVHFGLQDDPLARKLELMIGRRSSAKKSKVAVFRGVSSGSRASVEDNSTPEPQPSEMPFPPVTAQNASRLDKHRGHWVLRDPDIAMDRSKKLEDPW